MTNIPALHRLSDNLGITSDGDNRCIIYDRRADPPVAKLVLEAQEVNALIEFWHDGYCAACGASIPQLHRMCKSCLAEELDTWGQ